MGSNRNPQPSDRRPEANRRLDSWKEIAAFLDCGERTVKRWETERGLPVHRMPGSGRGRVSAYTAELSQWLDASGPGQSAPPAPPVPPVAPHRRTLHWGWWLPASLLLVCAALLLLLIHKPRPPAAPRAANPGAEDLYLQGRFYWNKRTPASLRTAVDFFAQAIVRDPKYAPSYVGLADCYNLLREFSAMPAAEAYPRALEAARKAVQLDDASAEAHVSLAFVSFYWNWDAALADREFRRAIELNPNYVLAHHWRANFLMSMHRLPEALREIDTARKLDPGSQAILADKGLLLVHLGRYRESLALLKQIEAQDPNFSSSHVYLAVLDGETKHYPEFLAETREAATLTNDRQGLAIVAAGEKGLAAGGAQGMYEAMLNVKRQLYAQGQLSAYALALTCGSLGRKAETLSYLRTALQRMEPEMVALRTDWELECVRREPAYQEIVRRFDLGANRSNP
jgi:tetratricopeptide (TPR) repeat protein